MMEIIDMLKMKGGWVKARDLCALCGYGVENNCRVLRLRIRNLTGEGHAIISGRFGFKIAESASEVERYIVSLKRKQAGLSSRIRVLEVLMIRVRA